MNKRIPALLGAAGAVLAVICPLVHALAWDSSPKAVPAPAAVEVEAQLPAMAPVHILLGDAVPVDVNLQAEIYGACGCDPELFCAVMAIAAWETRGSFDSGAVGDSGASYGILGQWCVADGLVYSFDETSVDSQLRFRLRAGQGVENRNIFFGRDSPSRTCHRHVLYGPSPGASA